MLRVGSVSEKRAEKGERAEEGKVEKERGATNGQVQGGDGGGRRGGEGEEKDAPLQLCLDSDKRGTRLKGVMRR